MYGLAAYFGDGTGTFSYPVLLGAQVDWLADPPAPFYKILPHSTARSPYGRFLGRGLYRAGRPAAETCVLPTSRVSQNKRQTRMEKWERAPQHPFPVFRWEAKKLLRTQDIKIMGVLALLVPLVFVGTSLRAYQQNVEDKAALHRRLTPALKRCAIHTKQKETNAAPPICSNRSCRNRKRPKCMKTWTRQRLSRW